MSCEDCQCDCDCGSPKWGEISYTVVAVAAIIGLTLYHLPSVETQLRECIEKRGEAKYTAAGNGQPATLTCTFPK